MFRPTDFQGVKKPREWKIILRFTLLKQLDLNQKSTCAFKNH